MHVLLVQTFKRHQGQDGGLQDHAEDELQVDPVFPADQRLPQPLKPEEHDFVDDVKEGQSDSTDPQDEK